MKIYYNLTETNHIGSLFEKEEYKINFENQYPDFNFNFIEKDLDEETYNFVMKYSTFLKEENGVFILDDIKYNGNITKTVKMEKINELKSLLNNEDYKIIKCYEAQLLQEEMPYNVQELLAQRKAWRDEINAIEFEISMLG
jgi:hypothetical protein